MLLTCAPAVADSTAGFFAPPPLAPPSQTIARMSPEKLLALALDPSLILQARGLPPDPWQRELLLSSERQVLLNCSRQSGKSTVVSALALHTALFKPKALVLLLSPSQRQSGEIFRKVTEAYNAVGRPVRSTEIEELRASGLKVAKGNNDIRLGIAAVTARLSLD
jgi:hypothetical protein